MIFWRKIVISHTKYPKNFRASLRSASCTNKTGCHDIAEILLKAALKHQKSNQNQIICK
jgi:hypothetical protein